MLANTIFQTVRVIVNDMIGCLLSTDYIHRNNENMRKKKLKDQRIIGGNNII